MTARNGRKTVAAGREVDGGRAAVRVNGGRIEVKLAPSAAVKPKDEAAN